MGQLHAAGRRQGHLALAAEVARVRDGAERQDAHDGAKAAERLRRTAEPRPSCGKRTPGDPLEGRCRQGHHPVAGRDRRGPGPQRGDRPRRGGGSGGPRVPARPGATRETLGDGLRFHFAALPTQRARAVLLHVLPRQRGPAEQSSRPPGLAAPGGGPPATIHRHRRPLHRRPIAKGASRVLRHDHVSRREVRAHPRHAREERPGGQHRDCSHFRSRRDGGRTRLVAEDVLLRAVGTGPAAGVVAGPLCRKAGGSAAPPPTST